MNIQTARATTETVLLRQTDGPVAVLTLNRPAARNSLSEALLGELGAALTEIAADRQVRAVVLAAEGPAFCAGHDLKELTSRRTDAGRRPRLLPPHHDDLQHHDAADRQPAAAGGRRGARRGVGSGLPARRQLRSRRRLGQGRLCHARRRYRPVLLDADGGAVAQRAAQARHGHAAHGRHRPGRQGRSDRPRQRGGAARRGARQGHRDRPQDRLEVLARHRHRQGRVLPPARAAARRGLSLRLRGDDREHDGARCRGRHLRVHREARSRHGKTSNWEDR